VVLGRSSQIEEGGYAFGGFDRGRQHRRLHCTNNENEIPPELRDKGTTERGGLEYHVLIPLVVFKKEFEFEFVGLECRSAKEGGGRRNGSTI